MAFERIVHQDDRERWLLERRNSIGASDCPAILGMVGWASPTSVQADKWGKLSEPEDVEHLLWGQILESPILEMFSKISEVEAEPFGWLVRDEARPWLHATPDGLTLTDASLGSAIFVQIKNTTKADDWAEGVPEYVYAQQQAEMTVTGAPYCYAAALIFGNKLVWRRIERDEEFIERWLETSENFWKKTQNNEPIVEDGSDATHAALNQLYPAKEDGLFVPVGEEWLAQVREYEISTRKAKELDKAIQKFKAEVKGLVGSDAGLLLPDGRKVHVQRIDMKESVRKAHTQTRVRVGK